MTKIFIASDHAGYDLKDFLTDKLKGDFSFADLGTNSRESVDYPDFAHKLAEVISKDSSESSLGILICGSGIGMSIVANRYSNVRAALCLNEEMAKLARLHNNANILVLGSRLISTEEAIKCLLMFLKTDFEGDRHTARLDKFNDVKI